FPTWKETEPLAQTARQAQWLQKWLSRATGEAVAVSGVLVLPGWYVERQGYSNSVTVLNGKEVRSLNRQKGATLTDAALKRIAHQLDQRCRTVGRVLQPEKTA